MLFLLLLFSRSTVWIVIGIMGFGYSMAGIYPTTVSFAGNLIEKYPIAWSFILTIAKYRFDRNAVDHWEDRRDSRYLYGMGSIVVVVFIDMVCILALVRYLKNKINNIIRGGFHMKTKKNQIWNFNNEIDAEVCGEGVKRKILAYADEMMCGESF